MPLIQPATPVRSFPLWLQTIAVALAAWLAVALVFGRTGWSDWGRPHWLEGDPLEIYARVQIAAEQPGHALASFTRPARLGAPFGADWSGYPVPDRLVFVLTGVLARAIGLITAVQIASAVFFTLNAVSFFLCARWLARRWEWAAALALAFAFCNYNLRWGVTLSLGQTFTLPPLVLLCARATRRSAAPAGRHGGWLYLGAGLGLWLAIGNPYLAFFAGVVGGGALVLGLIRCSPRARLAPLLVFLAVLTAAFTAINIAYAWRHWHGPDSGALARDLGDFNLYALRPLDWLIPPADHRIDWLALIGRAYLETRQSRGEFFYNYLGLSGIVGLVWLTLAAAIGGLRRMQRGAGDAPLGLAWIVAFGISGGINTWLGLAGVDMFRAGTRLGIFAVVWIAFFLCGRLAHATRLLPRPASVMLALGFTVFACWEQTPALANPVLCERNVARWNNHRELAAALERTLPPRAAVFQLPVVPFPEAGPAVLMPDYEHFLPMLASESLRFSYGHLRTAPAQRWARHVAALSAARLVAELEHSGFSALWIDRRGFTDEALPLVAQLRLLKLHEIPVPATLPITVFLLEPAVAPVMPDLSDLRLQESWDGHVPAPGCPLLFAVQGWYAPEQEGDRRWRWASTGATLGLWWEGAPGRVRLHFAAGGRTGSRLHLSVNGHEVWSAALVSGPNASQQVELPMPTGASLLEWRLEGRTFRPGGTDRRSLGFVIENLGASVP